MSLLLTNLYVILFYTQRTSEILVFAFSTQGGETGKRTMPLIVDDEGKRIIEQ
jgi:hypothetical protein